MIRTFENKARMLFTPKAWCNSVARWILGIHSETGTLRIKNTANPKAGGPSFDVDCDAVAKKLSERLNQEFPKVGEKKLLGPAFKWEGGRLVIRQEWFNNEVARANMAGAETTTTESTTDNTSNSPSDATESFSATFTDWKTGDKKMLKLRLYAVITSDVNEGSHTFHPVDLTFTKAGILKEIKKVEGKSVFIGA